MKSTLKWIFAATFLLMAAGTFAQAPASKLKQKFSYTFHQNDGTNASAVAWDPHNKVYVTVIAGNMSFPLEMFDAKGTPVMQTSAEFDWRGMWYNTNTNQFEGNGSGDFGWVSFAISPAGQPTQPETIFDGQLQPDFNCIGSYDAERNEVVFLDYENGSLWLTDRDNPDDPKSLLLLLKNCSLEDLNATTVICTGKSNYNYGVLDFAHGKLLFFNNDGEQTASSKFPKGSALNSSFGFSFANGHAFLYDKEARTWHAYKVW